MSGSKILWKSCGTVFGEICTGERGRHGRSSSNWSRSACGTAIAADRNMAGDRGGREDIATGIIYAACGSGGVDVDGRSVSAQTVSPLIRDLDDAVSQFHCSFEQSAAS